MRHPLGLGRTRPLSRRRSSQEIGWSTMAPSEWLYTRCERDREWWKWLAMGMMRKVPGEVNTPDLFVYTRIARGDGVCRP